MIIGNIRIVEFNDFKNCGLFVKTESHGECPFVGVSKTDCSDAFKIWCKSEEDARELYEKIVKVRF